MIAQESLGEGIQLLRYKFSPLGMKFGRNVTLMPLASGEIVIHSTAPFTSDDVKTISDLGNPKWILDATNFHDTFTKHASKFPEATYLTPNDFQESPSSPWGDEIEILPLAGMPKINEFLFLHKASGTLVLADLVFNLPKSVGSWTLGGLRLMSGVKSMPGNSQAFRLLINDDEAFDASLREILSRDFETIIVGHGDPIRKNAKEQLRQAMLSAGRELE